MFGGEVFVLSKGRPECVTARTLIERGYPGNVTIVCGNDDETVPQYVDNFGNDMVVVFDKAKQMEHTDMMDAFGTSKASGISPVRNKIIEIAASKGLDRCWQMDDDICDFFERDKDGHAIELDGEGIYRALESVEQFGRSCNLPVVGISTYTVPKKDIKKANMEACTVFNVETRGVEFRGRIFEDACCMFRLLRKGMLQFSFNRYCAKPLNVWYGCSMSKSRKTGGGMEDQYNEIGGEGEKQLRQNNVITSNVAYTTMELPNANVLHVKGERLVKHYDDRRFRPKVIRDSFRRCDG